jgi:hypothetical protein
VTYILSPSSPRSRETYIYPIIYTPSIDFETSSPKVDYKIGKMVYTIVVHLYTKEDPSSIEAVKAKLVEASSIYSKDKETLSWFVMQDDKDPRKFCIVERYAKESVRHTIFL